MHNKNLNLHTNLHMLNIYYTNSLLSIKFALKLCQLCLNNLLIKLQCNLTVQYPYMDKYLIVEYLIEIFVFFVSVPNAFSAL